MRSKIFLSLFIILIIFNKCFGQLYSFSAIVNGKPSTNFIRAYNLNKIVYISIDDLFSLINANVTYDYEKLRLEISLQSEKIYLSAYNPFVYYIKNSEEKYTYQMLQSCDYKYGKLFIPIKTFSEFLNSHTNLKVRVDEQNFLISLNIERSTQPIVPPTTISQRVDTARTKNITRSIDTSKSISIKSQTQPSSTSTFDLYDFVIEEKSNGYILRIKSKKQVRSISKNYTAKTLYVRIPNCTIDLQRFNSQINNGLITIISAIQNKNDADLKIQFAYNIDSHEIVSEKRTNDILILLHINPEVIKKIKEEKANKAAVKKGNSLDVIVIDPGHGGKDPGTIGYRGTKEKDVNLGIAHKLGTLIKNGLKNVKVVYTRDTDEFVELYRRGQIANDNQGKLFVSIHCNATDERPGRNKGFEVYLLRPGKTEDAIRIAERENSVIKLEEGYEERYKHLSDENFILTAMTSTANVRHSEKFAEILNDKVNKTLPLKNNGVKQAGFFVLVGASMPSVLIEAGYLNHPEDEMFLRSNEGQRLIAETIYKAIVEYKNYYESLANK